MRFKIQSKRVRTCLKGRGFRVCDLKGEGRSQVVVMEAPSKWERILVQAKNELGQKIFKETIIDGQTFKEPKLQSKAQAIVERVMRTPTMGLRGTARPKPEPKPAQRLALPTPVLKVAGDAPDPLEEAWEILLGQPNEIEPLKMNELFEDLGAKPAALPVEIKAGWRAITDEGSEWDYDPRPMPAGFLR